MNRFKIIEFFKTQRITKSEFCKKCKITIFTLDNIVYYDASVDFAVAERIAAVMGLGVYQLYTF